MTGLIVCDSFKGSLSSKEVGTTVQSALKRKNIQSDYLLISDGGEGFTEALQFGNGCFEKHYSMTCDSLFRKKRGRYLKYGNVLYFNLADTVGINSLKEDEINAYVNSTYGLGYLIKKAILKHRPEKIVLSLGGSCTNDLGLGILEGMGAAFYSGTDRLNRVTLRDFNKITDIDLTEIFALTKNIAFCTLTDVNNPLLGANGATFIYGEQKGIPQEQFPIIDKQLERIKNMIAAITGKDCAENAGSGAAGGVGFMTQSVFGSEIKSGIDELLNIINFGERVKNYDFVITGEGCFDSQSLNGKVVSGLIKSGAKNLIIISAVKKLDFPNAFSIVPEITSKENSLKYPKKYLKKLIYKIFS